MKKSLVVAVLVLASSAWAGGEMASRVAPPVQLQTKPWLVRVWDGTKTYFANRAKDVYTVGFETCDMAVGVVAADPAKDDKDSYLNNRGCDMGDVVVATGNAVVGLVGIETEK